MQIIESSSIAGAIKRSFDRPGRKWIKHIVLPDFQRPYCWSLNDIQKILDDIDELRFSTEDRQYREDEYYLGSICVMPANESKDPDHLHDIALLDGQQRLTSLMILAHVLHARAMKSTKAEIRSLGNAIDWSMGSHQQWKRAFLYRDPQTLRHIAKIHAEIERGYRQLEVDSALDDMQSDKSLSFYEETLLHDLQRFRYILHWGRVAVTVLQDIAEAEQYFQGENNRGLPMSLLDILKAFHMRFESDPVRLEEIRRIWNTFNELPASEADLNKSKTRGASLEDEVDRSNTTVAKRKRSVETHVIPALLMRCGIEPWPSSANTSQNADWLRGIVGTHRGDRMVDRKFFASTDKRLFDLLEPVQTGIGFFRMLDQYRRIDEALDVMEQKEKNIFNPTAGLTLNDDQTQILRLALIAWVDRFAPAPKGIEAFAADTSPETWARLLSSDIEFRTYARHFARFINRLRNKDEEKEPGAFKRLDKASLLRCLRYENVRTNLIFLPHRSATPASCKRELLNATTPQAMATGDFFRSKNRLERYERAYRLESIESEVTATVNVPATPKEEAVHE